MSGTLTTERAKAEYTDYLNPEGRRNAPDMSFKQFVEQHNGYRALPDNWYYANWEEIQKGFWLYQNEEDGTQSDEFPGISVDSIGIVQEKQDDHRYVYLTMPDKPIKVVIKFDDEGIVVDFWRTDDSGEMDQTAGGTHIIYRDFASEE